MTLFHRSLQSIRTRTLAKSGLSVTELGLGGAQFGNYMAEYYQPMTEEESRRTIKAAWDAGVRLFDTAVLYGYRDNSLSERRLGKVLQSKPRKEFVLSTKVGWEVFPVSSKTTAGASSYDIRYNCSYQGIMDQVKGSLERLQTSYLDIVHIHDLGRMVLKENYPAKLQEFLEGGYKALLELRSKGIIKAIGIAVMECESPLDLMKHHVDLDCLMLAGRYTLMEQTALKVLFTECEKRQISVFIAAPFNSGILSGDEQNKMFNYKMAEPETLAFLEKIKEVNKEYGIKLPQAALQFPLLHPVVVSVVPGLRSPSEVRQAVDNLKKPIPRQYWDALNAKKLLSEDVIANSRILSEKNALPVIGIRSRL